MRGWRWSARLAWWASVRQDFKEDESTLGTVLTTSSLGHPQLNLVFVVSSGFRRSSREASRPRHLIGRMVGDEQPQFGIDHRLDQC
jgi:hypothetical protein